MFFEKRVIACGFFLWLLMSGGGVAQTVEGDIFRGQGAFLRGAGWYNLRTAQANKVNVEATIRWKEDLRKIQRERAYYEAQKAESKKLTGEEFQRQMAQKEQELRTNPSINDVQSGAALNALFYDLTDPNLTADKWKSVSPVQLPPGTSIKELIFAFTPHKVSSQASKALTRGVIALSRLDIKDKWPVIMKKDEMARERTAYEGAYVRVRDKVLKGDYAVEEILALDSALDNLKQKTFAEIPSNRGFQVEAVKFVDDLRDATRMFDANTVDYAREILIDTRDHDAGNVEELVAFMTKYRLQFSNSERSPATAALYSLIYEKLRQQADLLNVKFDLAARGSIPAISAGDTTNSKAGRTVPAPRGSGTNEPVGDPGFLPARADGKSLNVNFEKGTLEGWKVEGKAFNGQPMKKPEDGKGKAATAKSSTGRFWVNTYRSGDGDRPQGTLTSETFLVSHPFASYLIAGGSSSKTRVEIVTADDNQVFHSASGKKGPAMSPIVVDMKKILGRQIFVRIVDQESGGWGHIIFDDFRFHNAAPKFQ